MCELVVQNCRIATRFYLQWKFAQSVDRFAMESSIYNGNSANFAIQSYFDHSTRHFRWTVTMSKTGNMFKTRPKTKAKPTTSNTSDQVKKNTVFVKFFLSTMEVLNLFELNQKKEIPNNSENFWISPIFIRIWTPKLNEIF